MVPVSSVFDLILVTKSTILSVSPHNYIQDDWLNGMFPSCYCLLCFAWKRLRGIQQAPCSGMKANVSNRQRSCLGRGVCLGYHCSNLESSKKTNDGPVIKLEMYETLRWLLYLWSHGDDAWKEVESISLGPKGVWQQSSGPCPCIFVIHRYVFNY